MLIMLYLASRGIVQA